MTVSKATADRMNAIVRSDINLDAEYITRLASLALPCARTHTGYEPLPWEEFDEDGEDNEGHE